MIAKIDWFSFVCTALFPNCLFGALTYNFLVLVIDDVYKGRKMYFSSSVTSGFYFLGLDEDSLVLVCGWCLHNVYMHSDHPYVK